MSKPGETLYNVSLKHLARDGKSAGADLPTAELLHITAKQFRTVLEAAAALAPGVAFPVEPELRVTTADGKFVVQIKGGKLNLVSWSSRIKGGEYSAARIYGIITGEEAAEAARAQAAGGGLSWLGGKAAMIGFIIAIIAINGFTIWFVTRPKKTLLPKYTVLPAGPAERLLTDVAGVYETGTGPGDRHLEIDKAGTVQRYKLSRELKPIVRQTFTVTPAEAEGKPALVTSSTSKAIITVADQLTVVLYGDKYKRLPN